MTSLHSDLNHKFTKIRLPQYSNLIFVHIAQLEKFRFTENVLL